MTYQLYLGDCLEYMHSMDANSIDAIVTDPPYGLGFMGKDWDHGVPGIHFWQEALRVAKPGAHLLAFGGTRTFHRLAVAIEDAGWEIRDTVMWVYGSGFPKSHDVSKAIDREAGAERETVGRDPNWRSRVHTFEVYDGGQQRPEFLTAPSTAAAAEWDGWGTALKPAWEPIIVARKPLEGTVAQNVQRYGTGAINVDACRIETGDNLNGGRYSDGKDESDGPDYGSGLNKRSKLDYIQPQGRWPANLIHDGSAEVLAGFPMTSSGVFKQRKSGSQFLAYARDAMVDGNQGGDTGSAARFFYCAKASKQDRDEGCEELEKRIHNDGHDESLSSGDVPQNRSNKPDRNFHPTVKPTSLMRYLVRLVTPPNGVILDPFMGSGSTGKAAMFEGFNFVGCEINAEYIAIAECRIKSAAAQPPLFTLDTQETEMIQSEMPL